MSAFYAGFSLGLSLISAIGAQNAFVLKQGLLKQHLLAVALLCACSDAVLIAAGVFGFDILTTRLPGFADIARYGGAVFLLIYGARHFYAAWRATSRPTMARGESSLGVTIAACAALTWLNPHVYLDTVVLLGSVSTQYPDGKMAFAGGASVGSFAFFFSLAYGARVLAPIFQSARAWRLLDVFIGLVMWTIAASLLLS